MSEELVENSVEEAVAENNSSEQQTEEVSAEYSSEQQSEEVSADPKTSVQAPEGGRGPVDRKSEEKKLKKHQRIIFFLGMIVGACIAIWITVGITYIRYFIALNKAKSQTVSETVTTGETIADDAPLVDESLTYKMSVIEQLIRKNYYKDVDTTTLRDGVFDGMMDSLGDPYSEYYSEAELVDVQQGTQGIYYGIGAYITIDQDTNMPVIADIISNTPAEEAGLQAEDIIYKVDGTDTTGMNTTEVVKLIKGEEHTTVILSLIRDGKEMDVEVERRKVESPTVKYEMRDNNIGYIQITEFDDVTTDQFTEAMAVLKGQDMKGLIIDLRSNGGGNLSTCIAIAKQLLPKGLIVYTEDKYGNREEYTCDGKHEFELPLVVLVNGYSASASEILTGAIKDYGIGTIMGTKTYGKGIVQQIIPLKDGTAVKMTISKYFTPKGNYIHETGIEPDIEVEFDSETYKKGEYDNQIEAAENELLKKLQ